MFKDRWKRASVSTGSTGEMKGKRVSTVACEAADEAWAVLPHGGVRSPSAGGSVMDVPSALSRDSSPSTKVLSGWGRFRCCCACAGCGPPAPPRAAGEGEARPTEDTELVARCSQALRGDRSGRSVGGNRRVRGARALYV